MGRINLIALFPVLALFLSTIVYGADCINDYRLAPVTMQSKPLDSVIIAGDSLFRLRAIERAIPSRHAIGDFNNDGLVDDAFILTNEREWNLLVFLQIKPGVYSAREITTFPGADSHWKTLPANKVRIYPITGTGLSSEGLGLAIDGMAGNLEFFWNEKNRDFSATMVHPNVSDHTRQKGKILLHALDIDRMRQVASCHNTDSGFDIDRQFTGAGKNIDLKFTKGRGSMIFYSLVPVNGAAAVPFGKSAPAYDDCRILQDAMSSGSIPELEPGVHFCVITNEKNLAHIWVQDMDVNHELLMLGFELWPREYE